MRSWRVSVNSGGAAHRRDPEKLRGTDLWADNFYSRRLAPWEMAARPA